MIYSTVQYVCFLCQICKYILLYSQTFTIASARFWCGDPDYFGDSSHHLPEGGKKIDIWRGVGNSKIITKCHEFQTYWTKWKDKNMVCSMYMFMNHEYVHESWICSWIMNMFMYKSNLILFITRSLRKQTLCKNLLSRWKNADVWLGRRVKKGTVK